MRNTALKKILDTLEDFSLNEKSLLDVFARDGGWQTQVISKRVKTTHAWEIEKCFEEQLVKNLPENAQIIIGDSHRLIMQEQKKFDIIVFDNPMGVYGEENQYCEHFDIIQNFSLVAQDECLVIFNVKSEPFNYESNKNWQNRRNDFFKVLDASNLSLSFLRKFYERLFLEKGFITTRALTEKRPQETGLYQFAYLLRKE